MPEKRKRGGQPGNHNALKHGYYSQAFKKADRIDFDLAAGVEGFEEEIALLRFQIKKAITNGDAKNLMPLVKAAGALEKLIRTDYKINGRHYGLREDLKLAMRDLIIPLGSPELAFHAIKDWCGYDVLEELKNNQTTNNGQNEAKLP